MAYRYSSFLIAAISRDGIIAINNKIPWQCASEMQLMRKIVRGELQWDRHRSLNQMDEVKPSVLVMGRKTFTDINQKRIHRLQQQQQQEQQKQQNEQLNDYTPMKTLYGCEVLVVSKSLKLENESKTVKSVNAVNCIDDVLTKYNYIDSKNNNFDGLSKNMQPICFFGGHKIYKECLDRALCPVLYITRMNFNVTPSNTLKPYSGEIVYFPKIDETIYERVATLVNNNKFSLSVYAWTPEYCQAVLHQKRKGQH